MVDPVVHRHRQEIFPFSQILVDLYLEREEASLMLCDQFTV